MKKLLLLGGSEQQIIAIKKAKEKNYYTILCDYLIDNPGQYFADKFYNISTTDRDAVLKIAIEENIDGIIAYASDPAAPTAAFVAEKLNLPTNPLWAVETLCNKDRFRKFLRENGFNTPVSEGYNDFLVDKAKFNLPVIIKPVDSSGSKGATVLYSWDNLEAALNYAFSFSRSHRIIVEEFLEKKHNYLIGGDIFVFDGKIVVWGLLNCHRDNNVNELVPVGKSYPLDISLEDQKLAKNTLQDMINKLGLKFGSVNVELIIDKNNKVWPIDIGPRAGGNMIPDLLGMIFNLDLVELAVESSLGKKIEINYSSTDCYYATHNLHTNLNGKYKKIVFSKDLEEKIIKKCIYKKPGDEVNYFDNASKALGIIFLKFDNLKEMHTILNSINNYYEVVVE